jgi:hypothetical protein
MCQRSYRIADDNSSVIEDLLKLGGGFGTTMCG